MRKINRKERSILSSLSEDLVELENDFDKISSLAEKNKKRAKITLSLAKEIESKKVGFIWMEKEKTRKYVHPDNVEKNLKDGWKKVKYVESKKRK